MSKVAQKKAMKLSSQLGAVQGTSEERKGAVQDSTTTAHHSWQRRNVPKSTGRVPGSARKPASALRRKFAVFDIDGTLIRWQLYHAIADALGKRELIKPEDYVAIKDARMAWKRREHGESFTQYQNKLVRIYESMLSQIKVADFEQAVNEIFDEYKDQVYAFTRDLIADLKRRGYLLFAISASQVEIIGKITNYYGFEDYAGSVYQRSHGKFSGKRQIPLGQKDRILKAMVKKHGATFKDSIAVGDSESDISMLEAVERPIVFNPTQKLFEYAKDKGWPIVVERKNVVYELGPIKPTHSVV